MTKFLDLRNKVTPQVKIIYKTVVQKRPWYLELVKIFAVIVIVATVVWGVSRADEQSTPNIDSTTAPTLITSSDSIGIFGTVGALTDTTISLIDAQGSEVTGLTSFTVTLNNLQKVQTSDYVPLILSDIQTGDRIIAHGSLANGVITADSITSFAERNPVATTTATSTEPISTTTPETATSSEDSASSTSETILEKIGDVVQGVIDIFTGTSTPDISTTTDEVATTTATTTEEAATTPEVSTTTVDTVVPEVVTESEATEVITPEVVPETPTEEASSSTE